MPGQMQQADPDLDRALAPAHRAWEALREHALPPSPRNYEFCTSSSPVPIHR